ncbi:hypothetical protein DUNSADRAFT_16021 [Dunaliella salina]|uniref:Uncharacterized protein n=1 Tax=Dunaliella salina TaxID=3046 RepID=A0ABQ7H1B1_DUNSA|nr:hypothetical protein DUNSADRAFT_16021 [Dunaliella salina]|eukprot:KAF5840648.1 hypothetical protein DUNSADRAFT_16021 [Dunaliella salina]
MSLCSTTMQMPTTSQRALQRLQPLAGKRSRPLCQPIRSADLKRPELKRPEPPPAPPAPSAQASTEAPQKPMEIVPQAATGPNKAGVTVEYQREQAKRMNKYFQGTILQRQITDTTVFGWTPKNEINNGRWVMFGWMVGLLTEYATGVDFPHQLALMASYLGIADFD